MPEIGESITFGDIDIDQRKCPFDHSLEDPPVVQNILIGDGQELGKKMAERQGTHLYEKIKNDRTPKEANKDPRDREGRECFKEVSIKVQTPTGSFTTATFPVTCGAHHCIPAQASLKKSDILQYMCKHNATHSLKGKEFSAGKVWSNVGYDVNGSQNGTWLPGNYAVTGGGTGDWGKNAEDDNETPPPGKSYKLTGVRLDINIYSRKWMYVSKAVYTLPGQFHDAHPIYSEKVLGILQKIWLNYEALYADMILCEQCEECKKRLQKIKALGVPTPFGLVDRLNKVSDRFKNLLNGNSWNLEVYTSKWGLAYMQQVKAKNPHAQAGSL
jgi:A nuclease family of the HNH/ENDO VII superfamily with conserved AHH